MNANAGMKLEIEHIIEARPRPGMSLDELEVKMKELGNTVLERRADCLLVGYGKQTVLKMARE